MGNARQVPVGVRNVNRLTLCTVQIVADNPSIACDCAGAPELSHFGLSNSEGTEVRVIPAKTEAGSIGVLPITMSTLIRFSEKEGDED